MITRIEAIALAFLFFTALPVTASPPVPPPAEINHIRTVTDIQCVGTVRETEYYTRRWIGATDGCSIAGNVITAPMTQARSITASMDITVW